MTDKEQRELPCDYCNDPIGWEAMCLVLPETKDGFTKRYHARCRKFVGVYPEGKICGDRDP